MIFISAGHHDKDPGAIANGHKESDLAKDLRDLIIEQLKLLGCKFISDRDEENLSEYIGRIKTGNGSVVCEIHFNAANPQATGIEVIIPNRHTQEEFDCAKELALSLHLSTGLVLRGNKGVKSELETHRGSLALMRKEGITVLPEICFISNAWDLEKYIPKKKEIAIKFAEILKKYDDLIG